MAQQKMQEVAQDAMRGPASQESQEPGESREPEPCDIALVFGHRIEAGGFVDKLKDAVTTRYASFVEHAGMLGGRRVVVVESGEGLAAASHATQQTLDMRKPDWVISAGFATALVAGVRRGNILMADGVTAPTGDRLSVGFKIDPEIARSSKGMLVGNLATSDELLYDQAQRAELATQVDAVACDLESSAIAQVCQERHVKFLAIRIITDLLDDIVPVELARLGAQTTLSAKLGVAAGAVFRRPAYVKDLWQKKEDAIRASDRLAKFLGGVLPQLK